MNFSDICNILNKHELAYEFIGDESSIDVSEACSVDNPKNKGLCFINDLRKFKNLVELNVGLAILPKANTLELSCCKLLVDNPRYVYSLIIAELYRYDSDSQFQSQPSNQAENRLLDETAKFASGVVVYENVSISENVEIQANTVIFQGVTIGKNTQIGANVVIHANCVVGENCIIESGTVIGGEGFGWEMVSGVWKKVPQVGRVVIGNNVSIGNNCSIDRGAIEDTIIEDNCIIDNLVHIAHNVEIGYGSAIAGQVGFAGTTKLGKYNVAAGQVGFAGHLQTVDKCQFMAKAGITKSIDEAGVYSGFPVQPQKDWQKHQVRLRQIDTMYQKLKQLEKEFSNSDIQN